jgi:hypothetical protein
VTLAYVFCISATPNGIVNGAADLLVRARWRCQERSESTDVFPPTRHDLGAAAAQGSVAILPVIGSAPTSR